MDHTGDTHAGRPADAAPDADNNLGRGAPDDRDERIQQKRRNEARSIEMPGTLLSKEKSMHREGQRQRASSMARRSKRGE
jgi:hypothetical protein